jgi:hypothetical protein
VSDRAAFFTSGEGVRQIIMVTMFALVPSP